MPEKSIDLMVTSPPYNIRNSTGGGMKNGSGGLWENAKILKGYDGNSDDMPYDEYVEWQRNCLTAMMRLLKEDGAIFYNHKWRVQDGLLQGRHEIVKDFPVRQIIIWQRSGGINFNVKYFLPTYEVIYLICKPEFKLVVKDEDKPKAACGVGDIWRVSQDFKNDHPAPFPVEIPKLCIDATIVPSWDTPPTATTKVVLDPFIGSGTTAIAAKELGVDWIGIDTSKEYCRLARKRINIWPKELPREKKANTKNTKEAKEGKKA